MKTGVLKHAFLFAAGAALATTMMFAQDSSMPGSNQQPMPNNQQNMPGGNTVGPSDNGMPAGMANYKASSFLKDAFENDQAQIQMSQLASQKAQSADVKQYGEQMVNVHTKLDEQLTPMAKQMGVSQAKGPAKKDKKELEKLQSLSGPDFENEYLKAMGDEQQRSLKLFDDETKDKMNQSAQEAAKADSPVLQQNYQILEKIAQAHNVSLQAPPEK